MSVVSLNHPEVIDACCLDLPPGTEPTKAEVLEALAGAPDSWTQPPSDEEITAMGEAAGQLLAGTSKPAWADEIINIIPEDGPTSTPAADPQIAAPTAAQAARKARKPRAKPVRTVHLSVPASAENPFSLITITEGHKSDNYIVRPIPSDWGTAFQVEKVSDPEQKVYHVNLDGQGGICNCKGHLKWGHCRHVEALTALRQHGKL